MTPLSPSSSARRTADAVFALMLVAAVGGFAGAVRVGAVPRGVDIVDGAVFEVSRVAGAADARRARRRLDAGRAEHDGTVAAYHGVRRTSRVTRGVTFESHGLTYCVSGEENLLAERWDEHGSRARRILVHELGHAIEGLALEPAEAAVVRESHAVNLRRRGLAGGRGGEFFAESTEAWFGVHQAAPGEAGHGPDFIRAKLPELAALFEAVYGPPR